MKTTTCFFTGHRKLPPHKIEQITKRLNREIVNLISEGVTTFISGGAAGFDMIAASLVAAKKEMGANVHMIFALPSKKHDSLWNEKQRIFYMGLLAEADEITYVSENYMADSSAYCICALMCEDSRTAQVVRYAIEKGLQIINVIE